MDTSKLVAAVEAVRADLKKFTGDVTSNLAKNMRDVNGLKALVAVDGALDKAVTKLKTAAENSAPKEEKPKDAKADGKSKK